jgi:succinate dehydrogenase hydrophobic anchor subunit
MSNMQEPAAAPNRSLARRVGRSILLVLGALFATTALGVLLTTVLMSVFDSAEQWQAWRTDHYWPLFTWRLMLYIALIVAWLKLKARLPQSERTKRRKGLLKIEVMVILLVLMVELSKVLFQAGGVQ